MPAKIDFLTVLELIPVQESIPNLIPEKNGIVTPLDHINTEVQHSLIKRSPINIPSPSQIVHASTKKLCLATLGLKCKPFALHKLKDILLGKKNFLG